MVKVKRNKLWTKDFTITIVGSFISMLGFAVTGYAFGLMVYEQTQSTFLYALMTIVSILPQLAAPVFAGAFFDRRSRRKAIYTIDFIYTAIYLIITLVLNKFGEINYFLYLAVLFLFGILNSYYMVAYDSFYPNIISPGNYSKAYSIGSLLYPIANVIMVPVAGFIYSSVGPVPLFAGATVLFLITAIVETQIKAHEPHLDMSNEELSNRPKLSASKQFAIDLKTGIDYLKKEKGLFTITAYFFCTMGASAVMSTLFLPYTQSHLEIFKFEIFEKSVVWDATILYSLIMAANTLGRIIGGVFHYKRKIKPEKKFNTALFVYIALSFLDGAVLFMPTWYFMALLQLVSGALAVTSFNIRISATQNYVPDNIRARFNATFQLLNAVGMIIGQLIGGALGEIFDPRFIVMFSMVFNLIAIFAIMYSRRKYVKAIYNCDI